MFYDLNIPKPSVNVEATLQDIVERAIKYGYKGFAITTNLDDCVFEKNKKEKEKKKNPPGNPITIIPMPVNLDNFKSTNKNLYFFNRLNIKVRDAANVRKFLQCKEIKKYDLLSFQPENQEVLKSLTGITGIDILSYCPENKCEVIFNRKLYNQFVSQDVYFELVYGPGIIDSSARRNLILLSHMYKTVGKSKNIIVTSGAEMAHQIRGPYDVINFNLLFGLSEEQSKKSISQNCKKLLLRARQRNRKAAMEIIKINKAKEDMT